MLVAALHGARTQGGIDETLQASEQENEQIGDGKIDNRRYDQGEEGVVGLRAQDVAYLRQVENSDIAYDRGALRQADEIVSINIERMVRGIRQDDVSESLRRTESQGLRRFDLAFID